MTTEEAEAKALNDQLIEDFPNLAKEVENYTAWQDGMETGSFLVYEDIFLPYVRRLIAQGDTAALNRVGFFIEGLLQEGGYAENVATAGVLEGLKATEDGARVEQFLGPIGRQVFAQLAY